MEFTVFQDRMNQVRTKVIELLSKYEAQTGTKFSPIPVHFDLRGAPAGQAGYINGRTLAVRFNRDMMMNDAWDHLYRDTVPHEVAHIICMYKRLDNGHGRAWKNICRFLGGSGETYHQETVVYARGRTFAYTTSTGMVVNISETRHRRIQSGQLYTGRDGSKIDKSCQFRLVA
jgi:predicted SprT family Zn-dependent metalloprotease